MNFKNNKMKRESHKVAKRRKHNRGNYARLIRVQQLATQRTFYKQFVQVCLLLVVPSHPSQWPSRAAGTPLGF